LIIFNACHILFNVNSLVVGDQLHEYVITLTAVVLNIYALLVNGILFIDRCGKEEREAHISTCIGETDGDTAW